MFGRQDSISNKSNDKQKNSGTGEKGQTENIIDQIMSTGNENASQVLVDEDNRSGNIFNLDSPTENIIVPAENKKQKNLDSGKKTTQKISLEDEDDISGFLNEPSDDESEEESDEIKGPQQDIYPGDNEAKQELYQDPPEVVNRLKEQDENDLLEEDTESTRTISPSKIATTEQLKMRKNLKN